MLFHSSTLAERTFGNVQSRILIGFRTKRNTGVGDSRSPIQRISDMDTNSGFLSNLNLPWSISRIITTVPSIRWVLNNWSRHRRSRFHLSWASYRGRVISALSKYYRSVRDSCGEKEERETKAHRFPKRSFVVVERAVMYCTVSVRSQYDTYMKHHSK